MMELENLLVSIIGLGNEVQKDLDHFEEKSPGVGISCLRILIDRIKV